MLCPACGSSSEATRICPGCGLELPAEASAPTKELPPAAPKLEPAAAPLAGAAHCSVHAGTPAAGTCARCGRFVCLTCVPAALTERRFECPECLAARPGRDAPALLKRYSRELVGSFVVLALGASLAAAAVASGRHLEVKVGLAVMTAPFALGLFGAAALFAVTGRTWIAWCGVALEALVLIPLALGLQSWLSLVVGAAPIYAFIRVLQVRELKRLVAAR